MFGKRSKHTREHGDPFITTSQQSEYVSLWAGGSDFEKIQDRLLGCW